MSDFNDQPYMTRRGFIAGLMAMPAAAAIPGYGDYVPVKYAARTYTPFDVFVKLWAEEVREQYHANLSDFGAET